MQFAATLTILASAVLSVVSAQGEAYTSLSTCANAVPIEYNASNFSISPSPLCINKPFCLSASGSLAAPITQGAEYTVTGRWLGRVVYSDKHDLCALLAANGTPCPTAAGAFNLNICVNAKSNLPAGYVFDFQFDAINGNNELIFCQATPDYPGIKLPHPASGLTSVNCP
ncbi:hypothetical protein BGW39_011140 [Mortierella sp. 14UC]|nr:hypothetical protein BGW39_011140 [Mortierella sp. 14UC]